MKKYLTLVLAMLCLLAFSRTPTAIARMGDDQAPKHERKKLDKSHKKSRESDEDEDKDDAKADKKAKDKDDDKDDDDDSKDDDSASAKKSLKEESVKDGKSKKPKLSPIKRLIEVRLDPFLVTAKTINLPIPGRIHTVRDLLEKFEKWGKDDQVGGILLNLEGISLSIPDVEELRSGIADLRKSGKKVVSYLNSGDAMSYLVACSSDEIAIAPTGSLEIPGMGRVFPFLRGMYQMQGIEYDVITAGRFKYPGFMNRREPNEFFTKEFSEILDSWFGDYVKIIADGRKLSTTQVRKAIDDALFNAQEARNRGLIDTIAYYDEFADRVVKRHKYRKVGSDESDFSRITSLQDVLTVWSQEVKKAQDSYKAVGPKIAILHARGPIIDQSLGAGFASSLIMRDDFVKTIEEIRKNKTIRAVVLQIDSPGGSGYASDIIWRRLKALDEEKPLVVSMGSVAGSGGYYIACPGRLIFAEPTTLTGSIGVLSILANQASMLNRMDVNVAEMKRGARSLLGSGHRDMPPQDRELLQHYILDFYEVFLDRVAAGRKLPKNEVRKIAEGRIYTGRQAKEIGLVDRLGGLQDALAAVREMADIPASAEIKLVHYPKPSTFGEFIEGLSGMGAGADMMSHLQSAAPRVTFDSQVRFFASQPKIEPLCWMAIPEIAELMPSADSRIPSLDLMNLSRSQVPAQPAWRP